MDIAVELSKIIINETSDQQVIVVKEKDGQRSFPIVIGIVEIFAIDRRLKGIVPPRPMTHDLMQSVIEQLGGSVAKITIVDLQSHTFYAKLTVKTESKTIEVDCRPSDAIALGVATRAPMFVAEEVFEKVLKQ